MNKNKKNILLTFSLIVVIIIIGIFLYTRVTKNNNTESNYHSAKMSISNETNNNNQNIINLNNTTTSNENNNQNTSENSNLQENDNTSNNNEINNASSTDNTPTEILISEFTTKIYTKDSNRQNNLSITCSTLNDTIIENDETFSFCDTIGKATSNKGYKKADVYQNGKVIKALGGGNCQVSSTLYNSILKLDNIKITERHSHSNSVPYVPEGKDAAVAYGSYDFKFINNTGNKIKISASCDSKFVYIKIYQIS